MNGRLRLEWVAEINGIRRRVKMLGSAPKNVGKETKLMMTLSQAFLIDYLIYSIKDRRANSVVQPIFNYYYNHNKYEVVRFLISYFTAIRNIFPEWDDPQNSILSKTIGVGALLKVLNFIFLKLFIEEKVYLDKEKIKEFKSNFLIQKLQGIQNIKLDDFKGGSSAGTVNQLKVMMLENIDYLQTNNHNNFSEFEKHFKETYSLPFMKKL